VDGGASPTRLLPDRRQPCDAEEVRRLVGDQHRSFRSVCRRHGGDAQAAPATWGDPRRALDLQSQQSQAAPLRSRPEAAALRDVRSGGDVARPAHVDDPGTPCASGFAGTSGSANGKRSNGRVRRMRF